MKVQQMSITSRGPGETRSLGERLGEILQPGDVILLSGELGAGKTTFCKGVAAGLGVAAEVTSPTFTLIAEYEGRVPLVHMDLYRLWEESGTQAAKQALADLGWEDYLESDAAVLIEWAGPAADGLEDALEVELVAAPLPRVDERELRCRARGPRSQALLDEWVKRWLF
ncbi:tRNA (adenosine(37)-N6)-threonylcarbamoyltransferase complex ATPase subunit type 1 TsaE [Alicyclobacillus macrosporangiidus]|uniref:tRNA threonylcarbamoyladenosine biosynthesis protein TsaE n=1 Tax=Alicyclobacillus macrosporangiidus TaxID=392015 RepID=A0A1I7KJR3_9BACL|nr:tRNA (adenosine(37)-N6)-threonylcarbamoyltransferase complex ATPase subunit type 1 TsaE [Alicyclobacillus macrosporangiidus]SFU97642.1 tRNA threonylcarbamoyladenosine biosynthesis protein TsaE [Alicyclobacillus macrosporangiidus]